MIAGTFHSGSGIGNQLARLVMTRVIALDHGYEWGMLYPQNCKVNHFMKLDMGEPVIFANADQGYPYPEPERMSEAITQNYFEKKVVNEQGVDIRGYDEGVKDIPNNTLIDGEFQGEDYYKHHLDLIRQWLDTEYLDLADDICVINIRGGEYRAFPDLILPKIYFDRAIVEMKKINPQMRFEIHTDDEEYARSMFPQYPVTHNVSLNWRSIRYAKYLILNNSSFSILPSLLNEDLRLCIAPKYHARHNVSDGYWALAQNIYDSYTYMDRDGNLSDAKTCKEELKEYEKN